MNISYTKVDDYLLPNLKIVDKNNKENLNKYGLKNTLFYFGNFMS